jgi:DNA-binding CsgD family transcriptional regulator
MTSGRAHLDVAAARRTLGDLRQLERELVELRQVRRVDALERVRDAVRRIGEAASPEAILDRAAADLGTSSAFDRVLISQVRDGLLVPSALWIRDGDADAVLDELARTPFRLEYPLVEQEVAQRQDAAVVEVGTSGSRTPRALTETLSWTSYVVVALTLRGATVGLLHADASPGGRAVDALDRELAAVYAEGLAGAFERAALREMLRGHREELGAAVRWMSGRLEGLSADADVTPTARRLGADATADALTRREAEVMRLLVAGQTNRAIAASLVISEGTVKYHVKNILRKLRATSRADAVARYLRTAT